jgi:hypothetical protein
VTVEEINTVAFKKEEEINTVETPLNKFRVFQKSHRKQQD